MATTVANGTCSFGGATYTVPANKKWIGSAWPTSGGSNTPSVQINGVTIAVGKIDGDYIKVIHPLVLYAGSVLSCGSTGSFGYSGQEFDI